MIKQILLFILPLICYSQNNKTSLSAIAIEYDINKIKTYYSPEYQFSNAAIDIYLTFIPDINAEKDYDRNVFEGMFINGKVKSAKMYSKESGDTIKKYKGSSVFDNDGFVIASDYRNTTIKYFYDEKRNMTKQITLRNSDTIKISLVRYNEKNQMIHLTEEDYKNKNYQYNLYLSIEYDVKGNPLSMKNTHPIKAYSYTTKISYDGNIVTETEFSNDKKVDVRKYWYSKNNDVIKYEHNKSSTTFNEYDEKHQNIKETTFWDGEFAFIRTYSYNDNGNILRRVYSNNPNVYEEINNYEVQYDSLNNIIYEKTTESSGEIRETYYEYEYY